MEFCSHVLERQREPSFVPASASLSATMFDELQKARNGKILEGSRNCCELWKRSMVFHHEQWGSCEGQRLQLSIQGEVHFHLKAFCWNTWKRILRFCGLPMCERGWTSGFAGSRHCWTWIGTTRKRRRLRQLEESIFSLRSIVTLELVTTTFWLAELYLPATHSSRVVKKKVICTCARGHTTLCCTSRETCLRWRIF